jgi:hypothetical protein
MTTMMTKNMMMCDYENDYDDYDYENGYDSDDGVPRIPYRKREVRAPMPINLPSLKKEKEEKMKKQLEKQKEEDKQKKIETFRKTQHTGIWGLPGWMVQDIDIPVVMAAKEQLQEDLTSGAVVMVIEKKEETAPVIEKKEDVRDGAFEVLADKEKMKSDFEKTELCVSITKGVPCPHGEKCRFLHDITLWKPRKCKFEDSCKFVKYISRPDGSFHLVNVCKEKVCKFIHGGETRENYHRRTKVPDPKTLVEHSNLLASNTGWTAIAQGYGVPTVPKKKIICDDKSGSDFKSKLTWLNPTPVVAVAPVVVKSEPVKIDWSQMSSQMKSQGLSVVKKEEAEAKNDEWITKTTKYKKKEEKVVVSHKGYEHQMTSLCRSVIQGIKCTHAVCRYAHDVEKITLRACGFESCRNVVCVGDGVYKNTGKNVCNYLHHDEKRESYYKRLDIYKFKK